MSEYLSQRKFAEHIGRSHVWVNKLVKAGKIPVNEKGKIPLKEGLEAYEASQQPGYDENRKHGEKQRKAKTPAKTEKSKKTTGNTKSKLKVIDGNADIEIEEIADDELPPINSINAASVNAAYNKAKLAEKTYQAKLKEIEYKTSRGDLVEKSAIKEDAMKTGAELREKLSSIAPRIAPLCEGLPAREIQGIIDVAINEALESLHKSRFMK